MCVMQAPCPALPPPVPARDLPSLGNSTTAAADRLPAAWLAGTRALHQETTMTDPTDPETLAFAERLRERLSQPMPLQQQRELALCASIGTLGASLAQTRTLLEKARAAVYHASTKEGAASEEVFAWATSLNALGDAIERADRDGMATILAVRVLLQL